MARQEIKAESLFFPAVSKDKMSTIDISHLVPCRLVRFVQIQSFICPYSPICLEAIL
jgi:hypothetical protein